MDTMSTNQWIFLRGLSRERRHWGDFPDIFKQHFPDATILTPDLPGCGIHSRIKSPSSISGLLEFVRNDIKSQIKDQPINILALSMGAMVALEWMKLYPDECHLGILINTSLKGINPFKHRLRPENYWSIINNILLYKSLKSKEQCILNLTSNFDHNYQQIIADWISYARNNPVSHLNIIRQLIAASRYKAAVNKPELPLLLLRSLKDRLVNSESSLTISRHWQLPVQTHPEAGHDLPLDDASWVCEQIKYWLDNQLNYI